MARAREGGDAPSSAGAGGLAIKLNLPAPPPPRPPLPKKLLPLLARLAGCLGAKGSLNCEESPMGALCVSSALAG